MQVTICAVGRLKAGPERDLIDRFSKRIVWPFDIREVEERRKLAPAELMEREAGLLEAATPASPPAREPRDPSPGRHRGRSAGG